MRKWIDNHQARHVVRTALIVLGLVYLCALPLHVAFVRLHLRRRALRSLVSETHSRAAIVAVYLNDRRNDIRNVIQSGAIQRCCTEGATADLEEITHVLGQFGLDRRFGKYPVFSLLVFIARDGTYRSVPVPDAKPLGLTFEALETLIKQLYIRPTYLTYPQEDGQPLLLLSVAVVSSGTVHGQLLAVLNPVALDDRLRAAPPFAGRAVYMLTPGESVYIPAGTPAAWRPEVLSLEKAPTDKPVDLHVADLHDQREKRIQTAVRTSIPTSEFSLVCLDPAGDVPSKGSIARVTLFYLGFGGVLLGLVTMGWLRPEGSFAVGGAVGRDGELFRALFENLPSGIVVADREGVVRFVSPAFAAQNGIPPDGAVGRPLQSLLGEVEDREDEGTYRRALTGRQRWMGRLKTRRGDGAPYITEVMIFPMVDERDETTGVMALQSDITPRVQVEQRLRQAQKMETVGVLADGIAHDFNNLLTVIQGNCNLLLYSAESLDTFARDNIDEILRACDRAASMTRRLLAFSRHREVQMEVLDLNEVVGSTEKMLSQLIRENIDMNVQLAPNPVLVKADIVQIEQVIINLTVNARDAMPRGGYLTVRVQVKTIGPHDPRVDVPGGRYALMIVEDTGHGIDEATRRRIFEPFFTTKSEKDGTGLGLTTVHTIVKEHGGDLTVLSEVGVGTTFFVYLPLYEGSEMPEAPGFASNSGPVAAPPAASDSAGEEEVASSPAVGAVPSRGRGILVLDDEESVLRMIDRALTAHGYTVFPARTDIELLVIWEEKRESIDLLVTDMVMPGMSGVEIAERLRQDNPQLKVLNISAYTDTVIMKLGGKDQTDTLFLQKPFAPDALVEKVNEMLA